MGDQAQQLDTQSQERLWTRSFAVCGVHLGPGAEHRRVGQPEVWAVWSHPRTLIFSDRERRWLNGGTISDSQASQPLPTWSMSHQALYDGATAAALVLVLEGEYPERIVGALRLK